MDRRVSCGRRELTMETINNDILIQILIHLSTKSLLQLKSVCKRWLSLISTHHFSVLHTIHHQTATATATATALLLRQHTSKFYHLSVDTDKAHLHDVPLCTLPSSSNIIQSCHGLLLCRSIIYIPSEHYVYNLATRLSRKLHVDRTNAILGVTLAFDPSRSAYYKVICVRTTEKSVFCYQIMVFNSKSSSWSVVVENFNAPKDVDFSNGIYWNNAVHWPRPEGDSVYFDIDKGVICKFPKTPVLNWRRFSEDMPLLVESGGHLHFSTIDGSKLIVFEMERDYSKWSKKYTVEYSRISSAFPYERICLFGIIRRQNEEQSLLLIHVPGRVMAYNFIDGSFEELIDLRGKDYSRVHSYQFGPHDAHQYVATLAPV